MEVELVRSTPGGMVIYRVDGKKTYTTPGSTIQKILEKLSEFECDYFTSKDLGQEDNKRVSECLTNLYRRGILSRSRGYIGFTGEWFYLYFSHAQRDLHDAFVEEYLEKNLPGELVEIYHKLKYDNHVWSNYDIRARYGAVDLSLLENYVRNGLLKSRHVKEHNGEYVHATFYWALDAKEEFIDSIIKDKLAEIRQQRTERIGKGKKFEAELEELFGYAFKHDGLVFRIYDHNRQVRKIIRGKLRIFDLVAYAMPYIRMGDKWRRLKWFHGSIPIVFEFKFNETIGAGWLATFVQEVQWAYGEHAIPAVVVGGESGRIYDSAWEYAKRAGNVWIIHGSQLEKLRKYFKEEVEASEPAESHSSPSEIAEEGYL